MEEEIKNVSAQTRLRQRRRRAYNLYKNGESISTIARLLGYSETQARNAIRYGIAGVTDNYAYQEKVYDEFNLGATLEEIRDKYLYASTNSVRALYDNLVEKNERKHKKVCIKNVEPVSKEITTSFVIIINRVGYNNYVSNKILTRKIYPEIKKMNIYKKNTEPYEDITYLFVKNYENWDNLRGLLYGVSY